MAGLEARHSVPSMTTVAGPARDGRRVPPAAGAPPPATTDVPVSPLPTERFRAVLDDREYGDLLVLRASAQALLRGRAVWCVNSTAHGGGVAEMLRSLLAFTRGAGPRHLRQWVSVLRGVLA
jgi:hypothetical protein